MGLGSRKEAAAGHTQPSLFQNKLPSSFGKCSFFSIPVIYFYDVDCYKPENSLYILSCRYYKFNFEVKISNILF